jgi:3-hydroxyacyl-CoA dehydrogenase
MSGARLEKRQAGIAVITIDNPPLNVFGHAVRSGLFAAIDACRTDPEVRAIVLAGAGKTFSAGADIREFGKTRQPPTLREVIAAVDALHVPVAAALQGAVVGGGLELALGCHYRVAHSSATLNLPEIRLGLIPGAGGTQRLPRLIGVEAAAQMILTGEPAGAARCLETGLVDAITDGDPVAAAIAHLAPLLERQVRPQRVAERRAPVVGGEASKAGAWKALRARPYTGEFCATRAVECIEATLTLPFEAGMDLELARFEDCRNSRESAALRYAFMAERQVTRYAGVPDDLQGPTLARAGVIGAGTMGAGIAIALANTGIEVTLIDANAAALERGATSVRSHFQDLARRGKLDADGAARRAASLRTATALDALADVDLVVEAVFEDFALKQNIFRQLNAVCRPGALLASNTSTLDIDALAAVTTRPEDVLGLHFFSPAHVMKLLEIVRGRQTSPAALAAARALARRLGKIGVVSGVCFGFIGNRMLQGYFREALLMLLEGAKPAQIDAAMTRFGMAMGPCAVRDLAGIDVGLAIRDERARQGILPPDPRPWSVLEVLGAAGRLGQKSGAGLYRYAPGERKPQPDPAVDALLEEQARHLGMARREIADAEIVERCVLALVTEGVRVVDEGIAQRASDVDVVWLHGYGFPRFRGGPLCWADQHGLGAVVGVISALAARLGNPYGYWDVPARLARLAESGGSLIESGG